MCSGNASAHVMAKYQNAGAHCIFGKDVSTRKMIEDMNKPPPPHTNWRPNSAALADLLFRFVGILNLGDLFCRFVGFLGFCRFILPICSGFWDPGTPDLEAFL
mmetsp:Transcript_46275/g.75739  ORF Transcript_46275/g.75739 Transcript_46275/m.75739 type:complete len:103 (-) Transcript_46275:775-1083(-)